MKYGAYKTPAGISEHDAKAYESYATWCRSLDCEPASQTEYLAQTAKHNPGVIAWAATK